MAAVLDRDFDMWSARLDRAIAEHDLHTVFQPIIDLQRKRVAGYEALTRFAAVDGRYYGPDQWFAAAAALGRTAELDALTLRSALAERPDLPPNSFLSINVDPESLGARPVMNTLMAQGSLAGVVIEITEHRPWDWAYLSPAVERLRSIGARFAVDDAGAGYSGLCQILQLRPSILKLDRALVDGVDQDEAKRALIEMLGIFASRIDAWILAEGVETTAEAQAIMGLEVPLVQGYYFARPGPGWPAIDPIALTELRQIPKSERATLHHLVDPVDPVAESDAMHLDFLAPEASWKAVIDGDRRPVGLLNTEMAVSGILAKTLIANIHSSPHEVGHRIATSGTSDPGAPVIVVDNRGHYVGLLSLRRLIRALSC